MSFVYFLYWFFRMAISFSHVLVAFVSIPVSQTFNRMIFGRFSFSGTRWHVVKIQES